MKKGFTLVELTVVIVIIGILASVAMPKFVDLISYAKNAATQGALGGLRAGVTIFYAQKAVAGSARWPTSTDEVENMMVQGVPKNVVNANSTSITIVSAPSYTSATVGWYVDSVNGRVWAANDTTW